MATSSTIAEIGLTGKEVTLIKTVIDLASGIELGRWQFSDDPISANVLFIDVDTVGQEDMLEGLLESGAESDFHVIACTSENFSQDAYSHVLQRPLNYSSIVNLLKTIESNRLSLLVDVENVPVLTDRLEPEIIPAGINNKIAPVIKDELSVVPASFVYQAMRADQFADRFISAKSLNIRSQKASAEMIQMKNRPAMRFYRYTRLLGLIHSIEEHGKPVFISRPQLPSLVICPEKGLFGSLGPVDIEPELFRTAAYKFHVQEITPGHLQEILEDFIVQPLWALYYTAAMFGSEGRLLEYFSATDVIKLNSTPDFSKVPHSDEHLRLSEYLSSHACDVLTLSEETGVDLHTIIDFCNACEEAGMIEREAVVDVNDDDFTQLPVESVSQQKTKFRHKVSSVFSLEKERERLKRAAIGSR